MIRILLCILLGLSSVYAQKSKNYDPDEEAFKRQRRYMSLNYFRLNDITLTKEDSLSFIVKNNDTLVLLTPSNYEQREGGVRVPYEYKSNEFLSIYKNIVYGTDSADSTNHKYMRYWKEPVKIYFHSSVPEKHSRKLIDFANEISQGIDSLNIEVVDTWDDSNYTVYYATEELDPKIDTRIKQGTSGYYIQWDKSKIYRGSLKIDTRSTRGDLLQIEQLKYHFLKSLGYFSSSKQISCRNYFSACPKIRKFTSLDKELLAYHYSYGICKGTDLKTFTDQHKRAKETLEQNGNSMYFVHYDD